MARKLIVEVVGDSSSLERSLGRASKSTQQFSRDFSKAERGVLSGSGVFRSLGRSLAFASGGFLAFGSAAAFIRKSIDAAKDAQVVQRQLATQLQNDGKAFADYRDQIDQTVNRLTALSGFQNDELEAALTTILRTVPNVGKALRDLGTAADLARARHIGLNQAAIILAKTEAGNTTLLRRQGFQIKNNAKVEEALATVRAKIAGQAAAGTTEQERFGAVLHDTEETIGRALLPTLNKYLAAGSKWLEQMNRSGKLQEDVAAAAKDFERGVSDAAAVVRAVDRVTGSFTNTLEILLALKASKWAVSLTRDLGGLVGSMNRARFGAKALGGEFAAGNASLAAQAGIASFALTTLLLKVTGLGKRLRSAGGDAQSFFEGVSGGHGILGRNGLTQFAGSDLSRDRPGQLGGVNVVNVETFARRLLDAGKSVDETMSALEKRFVSLSAGDLRSLLAIAQRMQDEFRAAGGAASEAAAKAARGIALAQQAAQLPAAAGPATTAGGLNLTPQQRNTFFDNAIARILFRGGLGDIQQQIAALQKANTLLEARLKVTKDVTRRLNLEDEILKNAADIKSLRGQAAAQQAQAIADALQKRKDSLDAIVANLQLGVTQAQATAGFADDIRKLKALQAGIETEIRETGRTADLASQLFDVRQQLAAARASQIAGRQFVALGLTATGEQRIPGVRALRRALGNVEDEVKGTFLDTRKTQSLLSSIRRVLSGGLGKVGEDVRAKIQQILGDLNRQLDQSTQKNLTKWRHLSAQAFLSGVPDLTPAQKRQLEARISTLGPGGVVPGQRSQAFSLAGAQTLVVHSTLEVDGQKMAQNTTSHQIRRAKKRTLPRSG